MQADQRRRMQVTDQRIVVDRRILVRFSFDDASNAIIHVDNDNCRLRLGWAARKEEIGMTERLDTSKGWCCDGRTWTEHAQKDGHCCQAQGTKIEALPRDGQEKARARLAEGE